MRARENAMLRSLLGKTLWDQRRALLGWSLGVAALVLLSASFWPSVRDQGEELQQVIDRMPAAMKALFDVQDFTSPEGYLRARLFSLMLPLLLLVYGIGRGADLIAGEEERGALDVLLAHPLSRRRVLLEKAAALALGVLAIALAAWVALVVGILAWDVGVGIGRVTLAVALVALLALCFGALGLALGAWRGRKGLAVGVASGVAVASYVVQSLSTVSHALEPLRPLSLFWLYAESNPLRGELDPLGVAVLALLPVALVAFAAWAFERRDVGV